MDALPNRLMTYDEASQWLGLPKGTLYAWVHDGLVPHVRLGRRTVRFRVKDLELFVAERAVAARKVGP
jgi:excisionase family DNA binding protein